MKKLYLLVILCLISSSAHAAWIKVWESDTSQHFVQSETVKYKNQLANFWLLTNHNVADESVYLSYKQKVTSSNLVLFKYIYVENSSSKG